MKKFLDIILISLLIFMGINLLTWDKEAQLTNEVTFTTTKSSYAIPASVNFELKNSTAQPLTINTCDNISILHNGNTLTLPEGSCKDITVAAWEKSLIDFASDFKVFSNPGSYTFELAYDDKKHIAQTNVKNRGTLGKLFVWVFYAPIYNLLIFLVDLFSNSLGWAIVAITLLIRLLLVYPQHGMMVSQRKLQAIQPKIKKLQEKHKKDSQKLGVELMALYKKEKVNPMGSCGFLLIQMPIILVIYNIILNIKSPVNPFYLYGFQSGFDMSSMSSTFFGINLLEAWGIVGICLAIFIWFIQFIQIKLSLSFNKKNSDEKKKWVVLEKKKGANDYSSMMPDPEMMNKFMLYGMPWMVAVFTYTLFAWIGLYWWISTLFAIVQQLVVNKVVYKQDSVKPAKVIEK